MKKFILFFAFASLFLANCNKPDPAPFVYPGVYDGLYTDNTSLAGQVEKPCVVTVTDLGNNNLSMQVQLDAGAAATLTATVDADVKLAIPEQSLFGATLTGTGEYVDSGEGLVFTMSKVIGGPIAATFIGRKQ